MMIGLDTVNYCISAVCENVTPFEDLQKLIFKKVISNNIKEIRIVCDIAYSLFKNQHFNQCAALEEWWNETIEDLNKKLD
jgi:hypothetical protein